MKSGVTWQVKVRQQARETAREAARRSGMSVDEWLDSVIIDSARGAGVASAGLAHADLLDTETDEIAERERPRRNRAQPEHVDALEDDPDADRDSNDDEASRSRHRSQPNGGGYRDDEVEDGERRTETSPVRGPRPLKYSDYDDRHRRVPDDLTEIKERLDELGRQYEDRNGRTADAELADVKDRLEHLNAQLEQRSRSAPDQELGEIRDRLDHLAARYPEEDFVAVNDRLDILTQQLQHLVQSNAHARQAPAGERGDEIPAEFAVAFSRLDQRLDQLVSEGRSATSQIERRVSAVDRAVANLDRQRPDIPAIDSPTLTAPASPLDQALQEIAERQRTLDGELQPRRADLPRASTQGLPSLEQQLRKITTRIETFQPCSINDAVETLRNDLAEIGLMLKDALPRKSVEALESEVRSLSERIDNSRHSGLDEPALAGVERGLAEVRDALRGLTPAESLVGLDEAVKSLTQKIDRVAASAQDPAALQQLEAAISGLRGVVSHVASDNALAQLSDEVRVLAGKVDQVAGSDVLATLEQRITTMADALQAHHHTEQDASNLDAVVAGLTDKIERLQLTRADHVAVNHLEDRIAKLVEKLDASDARLSHLEAIERGLAELLIHLEHQRIPQAGHLGDAVASGETDRLMRDVQRTQDSLEAVHGTLGDVVDRLAMIETGLRRDDPSAGNQVHGKGLPAAAANIAPSIAPAPPVMRPAAVPPPLPAAPAPTGNPAPATESERRPIDPNLPPDHPLEPGIGTRTRTGGSPADRIAASEAVLGTTKPPVIDDPGGKSDFIAAARRAAQAATNEAATRDDKSHKKDVAGAVRKVGSGLSKHARPLLVGTAVVLLVLGSLQIMMNWLNSDDTADPATTEAPQVAPPESVAPPASPDTAKPAPPAANPAVPGRQSSILPGISTGAFSAPAAGVVLPTEPAQPAASIPKSAATVAAPDPTVTGTVPAAPPAAADKAQAGLSAGLRAAIAKGDPNAQFEMGQRYADGRGVPQNLAEAAEWFERAAKHGLIPAQFRLGALYEKGVGVKKNLESARRLYTAAAEAGHAKAMHNLAVLYAEGLEGKADYQTAAHWFRKAADHGVIDSQYNLAILYARGIGVETNLAEAYKWFVLATREGDRDAAKKRDDVAGRLDPQTLAAARAAAQAWTAEPQPEAATQVKAPSGGWDTATTPATPNRRVEPKAAPSPGHPAQ